MTFNFAQEWPVLILIGVFIWFLIYAYRNGKKNSADDQTGKQDKTKK
jgi:cbb3-type cytochrome oxidase subunit 3